MTEPDFACPACGCTVLKLVTGSTGTYRCQKCGYKTHEKVERHREDLERLANSNNPTAWVADALVGVPDDV